MDAVNNIDVLRKILEEDKIKKSKLTPSNPADMAEITRLEHEINALEIQIESLERKNKIDAIKNKNRGTNTSDITTGAIDDASKNTNTQSNTAYYSNTYNAPGYDSYYNPYGQIEEFKFDGKPEDYINNGIKNSISDMVDKYYGNSNKEKMYNAAMRRIERAKVDVGNGLKIIGDYPGKANDLAITQLEQYNEKTIKLAKYYNGDRNVYQTLDEARNDIKYVKTNNESYNRYQTTKNNLMTLGKYGEKMNYLQVRGARPLAAVAHAALNGLLFVRNIGAVVYRGIGKPVSAIYGKIARTNSGIYGNKPFHRYEARKDYFIKKENERLASEGKHLRPIRTLFKSRIKAFTNYKEGNAAVLEAGYRDIRESYINKAKAEYFSDKLNSLNAYIQKMEAEKNKIWSNSMDSATMDRFNKIERAQSNAISMRDGILNNPNLQNVIKEGKIDKNVAVVQTDAVSLNQHDRANKATVTRIVTGVKILGGAAIKFTGPRLKEWCLEHSKVPVKVSNPVPPKKPTIASDSIPNKVNTNPSIPNDVVEYIDVPKINSEQDLLETFSIKNLMKLSNDKSASFAYDNFGNITDRPSLDYFRGAAQKIDGKLVSISDGNGYDFSTVTADVIPADLLNNGVISDNANLFDILAVLQRQAGRNVTSKDLVKKVLSCGSKEEQAKVIQEMTDGLDFCESISPVGMGTGWNSSKEEIISALDQFHSLTEKVPNPVKDIAKDAVDPSTVTTTATTVSSNIIKDTVTESVPEVVTTTVLRNNPRIVKALGIAEEIKKGATIMDAISMAFENLRDTKSKQVNKKQPRNYNPTPRVGFKGKNKTEDKQVNNDALKNDIANEIKNMER